MVQQVIPQKRVQSTPFFFKRHVWSDDNCVLYCMVCHMDFFIRLYGIFQYVSNRLEKKIWKTVPISPDPARACISICLWYHFSCVVPFMLPEPDLLQGIIPTQSLIRTPWEYFSQNFKLLKNKKFCISHFFFLKSNDSDGWRKDILFT